MSFRRPPVVTIRDGKAFTTSVAVAAYFRKRHDNVLRDIDGLIKARASIALNFEGIEHAVEVGFGIRTVRAFEITKDGFTLLAMGFTGAEALDFNLAYVDAFNRAQEELEKARAELAQTRPALPNFSDPIAAARAWADEAEGRRNAEAKLLTVEA